MAYTSNAAHNKKAKNRESDADQEAEIQKAFRALTNKKFKRIAAAADHFDVPNCHHHL